MTKQRNKIYDYILICDYKVRFVVSVHKKKKRNESGLSSKHQEFVMTLSR